ncbi:MAG TPA: DbpA RNA binding domain-containing protein, partial [Nevskia sp.]|nr:DbpA RNA binding domain-containing protein [Nevskia sp.]
VNYDIPTDTESYVHRIGRTGRAGRSGDAILFIAPRERHLLRAIERATRQPITPMELPSVDAVNDQRIARFKQKIGEALGAPDIGPFRNLIEQYEQEHNVPAIEIAAALARMVQGDRPLLLKANAGGGVPVTEHSRLAHAVLVGPDRSNERVAERAPAVPSRYEGPSASRREEREDRPRDDKPRERRQKDDEVEKETYRVEVGHAHGVKPGNIVGAIANEAGIESEFIGRIDIRDDHSFIDLPTGMPKKIFKDLQKVWVVGRQLRISRKDQAGTPYSAPPKHGKPKHGPR